VSASTRAASGSTDGAPADAVAIALGEAVVRSTTVPVHPARAPAASAVTATAAAVLLRQRPPVVVTRPS
jgi:hypothetical protein